MLQVSGLTQPHSHHWGNSMEFSLSLSLSLSPVRAKYLHKNNVVDFSSGLVTSQYSQPVPAVWLALAGENLQKSDK